MVIDKWVGGMIEVIYMDGEGKLSQRRVKLHAVKDGKASVYDVEKRVFRTFATERILAAEPIRSRYRHHPA